MIRPNRTKSSVMVAIPDLSGPAAQALKSMLAAGNEVKEMTPTEFGYVQTSSGMYCLCREGVGSSSPVTETNKLLVAMHATWPDGSFSFFPDMELELSDTEIIMLPTNGEEPLESFIRSFGRRLEANYEEWRTHFLKHPPMEDC